MPSGSYNQVYVLCPFYKWDDGKKRITCEGIVDGSSLAQIYHRRSDFEQKISVYCSCHFKKCELYRLLQEKYEEED